jgi:hypothetical protein
MVLVDFITFHFQHEIYITNLTYENYAKFVHS